LAITLLGVPVLAQGIPSAERQSGSAVLAPDTRAMQDNDRINPAMLWAMEGERLWSEPAGPEGRSCRACHGPAEQAMHGVAVRHPRFDPASGQPVDLDGQIESCRTGRQQAPAFGRESRSLLALSAYLGRQSRGLSIAAPEDRRLEPALALGEALFKARIGQLNLSCAQCHDALWGRRLGGSLIPQGHPDGYPVYRLEWQSLGSLQRRIRNCMTGVRAEPYPYGSAEMVALELYLKRRAAGMPLEAPGVRP